jgi:hypothetical protein
MAADRGGDVGEHWPNAGHFGAFKSRIRLYRNVVNQEMRLSVNPFPMAVRFRIYSPEQKEKPEPDTAASTSLVPVRNNTSKMATF